MSPAAMSSEIRLVGLELESPNSRGDLDPSAPGHPRPRAGSSAGWTRHQAVLSGSERDLEICRRREKREEWCPGRIEPGHEVLQPPERALLDLCRAVVVLQRD